MKCVVKQIYFKLTNVVGGLNLLGQICWRSCASCLLCITENYTF